ncbi:MAG: sigma-70 family RNA polymerase sigma factor [Myxococcales bacterium]|nr:sigma-70 family RNA polymerase sigma factor [Myxococcales bacterium]
MIGSVEAAQAGDLTAFTGLVNDYRGMATAEAWIRTTNAARAEEVVQEAFIDAWRLLPTLREPRAFGAWLRTIVRKHADRVTRRRRPEPHAHLRTAGGAGPDQERMAELADRRLAVRRAVEALPVHQREVVRRFYLEGDSIRGIAGQLGLTVAAVKKRLFDARRRLHPELEARMADTLPNIVRAFVAARTGDLTALTQALDAHPELLSASLPHDPERAAAYYAPGGGKLLRTAVEHGRAEIVALLLRRGADPDAGTAAGTALHDAVTQDRAEVVDVLLAGGARVDAPMWHGGTALHLAAALGRPHLVRRLLAAGADAEVANVFGRTARTWAEERGHEAVIAVLDGADPPDDGGAPGRVLDPAGNPLDGGPALPAPERTGGGVAQEVVQTGIKAVDLLSPVVRGGILRIHGGPWVGKTVLLGELMLALGPPVLAAFLDRTWEVRDFEHVLRELGSWDGARVVMASGPEEAAALAHAALAHAEAQGTVLVADDRLVDALRGAKPRVPVLAFSANVHVPAGPRDTVGGLHLALERSQAREYPAVDVVHTTSGAQRTDRHVQLADAVREQIATGGPAAERLLAYLTQPFHVAAPFNGRSGVAVPLAQTLDDVEQLLAGAAAETEVTQLRYVGALETAGTWPTHEAGAF